MRRTSPRPTRCRPGRAAALLLVLAPHAGVQASGRDALVRPRLAPRPSSRSYVALDTLARRCGATVSRDAATGVFRMQRGSLRAAVVGGFGAVLVGSKLESFGTPVQMRYGRAYVPRAAASSIERLFRGSSKPPGRPSTPGPDYVPRVCVDAGHGGRDPGGPNRWGPSEKHIVLPISKMLRDELRRRGIEVVMTREADVSLSLSARPLSAARGKARLFLSVHANCFRDSSIRGIEILYCDPRKYDPTVRAAAAARAGRRPHPDDLGQSASLPSHTAQAIQEMLFEEYYRESRELAKALERAFTKAGLKVRSVRSQNLHVLREAEMPALLLELGYLTNRTESRLLQRASHRAKLVRAIADGLEDYRRTLKLSHGLSN